VAWDFRYVSGRPPRQGQPARALLGLLVQTKGPRQFANIFESYATVAKANPENQESLFGDTRSPDQVFGDTIARAAGDAFADAYAKATR